MNTISEVFTVTTDAKLLTVLALILLPSSIPLKDKCIGNIAIVQVPEIYSCNKVYTVCIV